MNAPWWRLTTTEPEQPTEGTTLLVARTDETSELLPPFFD